MPDRRCGIAELPLLARSALMLWGYEWCGKSVFETAEITNRSGSITPTSNRRSTILSLLPYTPTGLTFTLSSAQKSILVKEM